MSDLQTNVTNTIIKALETAGEYSCPWHKLGLGNFVNLTTNKQYSFLNMILLAISKSNNGYTSNKWLGVSQAITINKRIKREEFAKKTWITAPVIIDEKDENGKPIFDENGNKLTKFVGYRGVQVYNASQLENYEGDEIITLGDNEIINAAQAIIEPFESVIDECRSDMAYYNMITDRITLPLRNQFKKPQGYYKTAFHELTHYTGHKSRCNRDLSTYGNDIKARAFEEIIAELGSAFLCAETGIEADTMEYHESYIKSWLEALRNDNKMIFRAASEASKAVKWIKGGVA